MSKYELYHGDCLEILPRLAGDGLRVDAIVTDPPYNISSRGAKIVRGRGTVFQGGDISLDFGEWDYGKIKWKDYIDLLVEGLTANGVLVMFYDQLHLGSIGLYLSEQHGFQVRHIGAIVKRNPAPQARRVKWQNGLEQFIIATKNRGEGHHFNYHLGQSPDYFETTNNYEHLHPTQKPLPAMIWLVRYWSFVSDTVLDPFMGSGSTGVACMQTGRNFIGIEIDKKYFEIAKKRIEQAARQPLLLSVGSTTTHPTDRATARVNDGAAQIMLPLGDELGEEPHGA